MTDINVQLRKGTRIGEQIVLVDGVEYGRVGYERKYKYTFYHPAPKHGGVFVPFQIPLADGRTKPARQIMRTTNKEDITAMAARLIRDGHMKPKTHWQAEHDAAVARHAKAQADQEARERRRDAADDLLTALKEIMAEHALTPFSFPEMPCFAKARAAIKKAEG